MPAATAALATFCDHHRGVWKREADHAEATAAGAPHRVGEEEARRRGRPRSPSAGSRHVGVGLDAVQTAELIDTVYLAALLLRTPPRRAALMDLLTHANRCNTESAVALLAAAAAAAASATAPSTPAAGHSARGTSPAPSGWMAGLTGRSPTPAPATPVTAHQHLSPTPLTNTSESCHRPSCPCPLPPPHSTVPSTFELLPPCHHNPLPPPSHPTLSTHPLNPPLSTHPPPSQPTLSPQLSPSHLQAKTPSAQTDGAGPYTEALLWLYRSQGDHKRVLANLSEAQCCAPHGPGGAAGSGGKGGWTREQYYRWTADYLRWLWHHDSDPALPR